MKVPRLYSMRITLPSGKIVDKMLGVAFNVAQRQSFYSVFRNYEYWAGYAVTKVEWRSEPLFPGNPFFGVVKR